MKYLALAVLACVAGCNKATELLVVFSSSVDQSRHPYDSLVVDVTDVDTGKSSFSNTYPLGSTVVLPASIDLHADDGTPTILIDAELMHGSQLVVERRAQLSFVSDHSLELGIDFVDSCAGKVCDPGLTCLADDTCSPDAIDATTLPPIGKAPLAPADMTTAGVDAATGPSDMGPLDFAGADLGSCAAVPAMPPFARSCVVYDFTTTRWQTYESAISLPASGGATLSQECPYLNIHIEAGIHATVPGDIVRITPKPGATTRWTIQGGYNYTTFGDGYAGVLAYAGPTSWWETGTTNFTDGHYRWFERDNTDTDPTHQDTNDLPLVPIYISVTSTPVSTGGSTYGYIVGEENDPSQQRASNIAEPAVAATEPSFFVSNESDGDTSSNDINVELAWLAVCPVD